MGVLDLVPDLGSRDRKLTVPLWRRDRKAFPDSFLLTSDFRQTEVAVAEATGPLAPRTEGTIAVWEHDTQLCQCSDLQGPGPVC